MTQRGGGARVPYGQEAVSCAGISGTVGIDESWVFTNGLNQQTNEIDVQWVRIY